MEETMDGKMINMSKVKLPSIRELPRPSWDNIKDLTKEDIGRAIQLYYGLLDQFCEIWIKEAEEQENNQYTYSDPYWIVKTKTIREIIGED